MSQAHRKNPHQNGSPFSKTVYKLKVSYTWRDHVTRTYLIYFMLILRLQYSALLLMSAVSLKSINMIHLYASESDNWTLQELYISATYWQSTSHTQKAASSPCYQSSTVNTQHNTFFLLSSYLHISLLKKESTVARHVHILKRRNWVMAMFDKICIWKTTLWVLSSWTNWNNTTPQVKSHANNKVAKSSHFTA